MDTKKIVLIGDAKVGKTTFVSLLLGKHFRCGILMEESFSNDYTPTLGVEVHPIRRGTKCYNIWDCAGLERFGGLRDGYWIQAQGAIVMCDSSNLESIQHVEKWANDFKRIVGNNVPIVYVINKSEMLPNGFQDDRFVKISCKNNENIDDVLNHF